MFKPLARSLVAICGALLPLIAFGSAGGTCTAGTDKLTIVDGVIYKTPNSSEEGKFDIVVTLASIKLDAAKIAAAKDPEDAVREQVWAASLAGQLRITLRDGAVHGYYVHVPPGSNESHSGSGGFGDLKLSRSDAKGAAGHFAVKGSASDDASCDVSFDVNY